MIWSDRPRIALSIGAATLVPVVALVWLGLRVLKQDREIDRQRQRERLEVIGGRIALDIERRLTEIDDRLARGQGIRLLAMELETSDTDRPLLYHAESLDEPGTDSLELTAAEVKEFRERDLAGAAAGYRSTADARDPRVRAAALAGLARVLRQQHDRQGAVHAYAELEAMGGVRVDGQPAALLALQGRARMLRESGDPDGFRAAVGTLADRLNAGTWRIDRATFHLYRDMLVGWGAPPVPIDSIIRSEAALHVWQDWRAGSLPVRGRRVIRVDDGTALAVWGGDAAIPRLWVATAAALETELAPLWQSQGVRVSAFDSDGAPLFGAASLERSLSMTPAETRLPFILAITPASDAHLETDSSRRVLLIGGLAGALLLIMVAAGALYRTTSRELLLARQQSDFVSAISHEFRTPLTSMRHLTDLLGSRGVTSEERRAQYYDLLAHETERLSRMVETLLSFGRIEAGAYAFRLEPADPAELVTTAVDEFRRETLARGREIACEIEDGLPPIHADRETLARALWNLLENAAKYSEPGTPIRAFARRRGTTVHIGVGDRGIGIAAGERERIFHKFVRGADATRAGIRGVGIGLALVKRIVEAHGGSMFVESAPGRGSTFTIALPATGNAGRGR